MIPPQPQSSAPLCETCKSPYHNGQQPTLPTFPYNQQNTATEEQPKSEFHSSVTEEDQKFFKEMREGIMIVAILAAGSTYQAGLNPPGSVWQNDDPEGHKAGEPILHDIYFPRYQTFFYLNAISFLSSLVIIIFLMNKRFYLENSKIKTLQITMVLDLFTFMAAYAVGSCRRVTTSIYVFLIMGAVFMYVLWLSRYYRKLRDIWRKTPCYKMWKGTSKEPTTLHP